MIIHMIRIAGNADGTDHTGAAQPDRETAACGVLVRVELTIREGLACVLQLCEKPQRGVSIRSTALRLRASHSSLSGFAPSAK